jgi:hypothetical protein
MPKETMNDRAHKDAKRVAEYLKKNYPGQWVKKGSIRMTFDFQWNHAANVFALVEQEGILFRQGSLMAPSQS